jgi:CubicO group peptidase (beta-lactamase class C family)
MDRRPVTERGRAVPLALLLLSAALPGAAPASVQPEQARHDDGTDWTAARELTDRVPRLMERLGVPGLVVVVLAEGKVAWARAFGSAEPAAAEPLSLASIVRVESISKPVTAWGVLRLVEKGRVALDDPVRDHLTRWTPPPGTPPITVGQLLSHTGGVGLGDYSARYPPEGARPSLPESLEREFEMGAAPGTGFRYSDTGFNLLQLLVEDVTGTPFATWMDREVLGPLGMHDATFRWTTEVARRLPAGHTLQGDPVAPYVYPGQGSGGLFATAHDLARFAAAGMEPPWRVPQSVLTDASIRRLQAERVRVGGLYGLVADGYGLGHFTERLSDGRRAVWHGGQGYGWMTHLHLVPATGDALVLLANSQRAWPLFAHVLRAWSGSLGVAPVGMARLTLAAPLAWGVILLLVLGAVGVGMGALRRRRVPGARSRLRPVRLAWGVVLLATVGWCATRDYLFLFSVLPGTARWLGVAGTLLGVALVFSALPRSRTRVRGAAAACLALAAATPTAAQEEAASVELGLFPASPVSEARSGPFAEASVESVRASLVLPLAYRTPTVALAARLTGSYTGIDPRPLDPSQPVWVEALYDLELQLIGARRLGERWWLTVVATPGIASDLRNVGADHLTAQGTLLLQRAGEAGPSWGAGLSVSNAFGETRVVPLLSLEWQADAATIRVLAPAEASVALALGDAVTAAIQATLDGNVYTLGRRGILEGGVARYSVWEVGPRLEVALTPRIRLTLRGGLSLGRRLEVEDRSGVRTEDAGLEHGASLAAGLSLVLPSGDP